MDKEYGYSSSGELIRYTIYEYKNGLLCTNQLYTSVFRLIREVEHLYTDYGKIIMLESKELSLMSSARSYVLRYEYD